MENFFTVIRNTGLRRSSNRWIAGVCGGIAGKLGVSPAAVRIIVLVLALFPGPAATFYLWAWLLLPDASGKIVLQSWLRDRSI
jgi:phage shock protein PspC (stress-responsive transcriptional regulator)